ncbi:ATP-binding cassette domain-containing protein [Mucilaginibacter sp. 14171R-50]|uniref:ATP-binding cassette domain-containing protein n=1 Tax=Mucilaginibacter sp. 14171R-50 TaxID=2703789 RepID=UPI00138C0BCC|nr:ATP-binding cassette domain-containing protein [Mucilaginibacter sp. 14171R-50]QHS56711.1 ATP-binding cassette domain-containing protein [Mucilaginibacter sp. 14171R-50]
MTLPLINIHNASIKLPEKFLSTNLNFVLHPGQNWALIGKSGSGKSVLLQVIAGNMAISGGNITYGFMDEVHQQMPLTYDLLTFHRFIAFAGAKHHFKTLSNTSEFYYQQRYNSSDAEDSLTVRQYLQSVKVNNHRPPYWTFDKTVASLNLTALCDKQTIKLSNGETKRLMIAAALLKNPIILLLDNPLTGLDTATRKAFNDLLSEVSASGISIIMATSAFEIPDCITNVAMLDNGCVSQSLSKQEYEASEHFTAPKAFVDAGVLGQLLNSPAVTHRYNKIVSMTDVLVKYGDKVILNKINWQINPGERWALLGPNGAGKSTLLSLINGDNPQAYANNITLFDKKRGTGESIWDIKSKIGFVSPELYQYFPTDNSCLQVIESGFYDTLGLFRPSSQTNAHLALNWMKALEIDQYARQLLKNIPASAQRLCLLARALIKAPALLIFDEPCQGLDDHQQQHFKAVVDAICSISNVTLIYVTHYQHEIPDSVDRVLRLDKGLVVGS